MSQCKHIWGLSILLGLAVGSAAAQATLVFEKLPTPFPTTVVPRSMHFISPTTGWIVGADQGEDGSSDPAQQQIFKTTDGGQTWTSQLPLGQGGTLFSVYALDAEHVYAVGNFSNATYDGRATSDGGTNWLGGAGPLISSHVADTALFDVQALSTSEIWALSYGGHVVFSTDGLTYTQIATLGTDSFHSIAMVNASTGYVAGGYIPDGGSQIFKTTDAGATWLPVFTAANGLLHMQFVSESVGWAGGFDGDLYRTVDAGTSWTLLPSRNGGQIDIGYFDFLDELHGWVMETAPAKNRTLWRTNDGGETWEIFETFVGDGISMMSFADRSNGWVLSGSHLYRISPIPVPAALPAFAISVLGVALWRRRTT